MFVAFASEFGRTASDVGEKSGPYAAALAAEMVKPGQSHLDLFQNVKEAVTRQTGGRQSPWELNGLSQRVRLGPDAAAAPSPPSAAPPTYAGGGEAERAWGLVKDSSNVGVLEAFAKRYSDTFFADLARARIEELKKQQVAVAVPPPAPVPVPSKPAQPTAAVTPMPQPARCDGVEAQVGNERRCLKPKDTFKDCPDCPEMVVIPAGEFTMGSPAGEEARESHEGPIRKVMFAKPLGVGKFEVTFAEWDACVAAGGCKHNPNDQGWGRGKRPVVDVSWDHAKEYIAWLSKKTGRPYRLLAEAEWEYAARAGTMTPFSTGLTITTDQANFHGEGTYGGSASGVNRGKTVEVGSLNKPNAFGLHDMHGNVWEWVEDCYQATYAGASSDGRASADVAPCYRVLRGGSWNYAPQFLRSANRYRYAPVDRKVELGFRVATTL
jgi:formylglycine-generating enzyme required for sulfatase activity